MIFKCWQPIKHTLSTSGYMKLISWIPTLICFSASGVSSPTALSQDGSICLIFFFNTDIVSAFPVLLIAISFSVKKLRKENLKKLNKIEHIEQKYIFQSYMKGSSWKWTCEDSVSNLFLSVSSQVPDRSWHKGILNFLFISGKVLLFSARYVSYV